ncbi:multiple inositol polyphosphate phosphatase 1-like [Penaeus monodon]|uniref:multiple inositol polyphosphate phosphatase 1-like n=1 Tax=Penaeus monodon TaxID=6687 RepID=UPI0018A76F54|nr:multiple inositol polyphosphate phosphatase 1-like [Penaeus monodon]
MPRRRHSAWTCLVLLCCASLLRAAVAAYCYSDAQKVSDLFSSKSPYAKLRGNMTKKDLVPESCHPVQLWHLVRHGSRYPSEKDIRTFMDILPELKARINGCVGCGKLCSSDKKLLHFWLSNLNESLAQTLAPEGAYQQEEISSKFLNLFPEILPDTFATEDYKFRYTATQRTKESAMAYARGAFGSHAKDIHMPEPVYPDPLLQFDNVCSKYLAEVELNETSMQEERLFRLGRQMKEVVGRVGERTGVFFTPVEVQIMYDACRYYTAWEPETPSAWCAVFTKSDLKVLEYWQDLKYYYKSGYGHRINYEQACRLVQDLVRTFRKRVEEGKGPRGVFYFTHLGAYLKLMARLGMFWDNTTLTHEDIKARRLWRTSIVGPFSANVAFLLSRCPDDRWYVGMAVNERRAKLPGCRGDMGCTWEEFLALLGQYENCDFDAICENDPPVVPEDEVSHSGSAGTPNTLLLVAVLQPLLRLLNRES